MRPPYPATTMHRARELHEIGWTPTEIRNRLGEEGHDQPSVYTIRLWIDPKYKARQHRAHRRQSAARTAAKSGFRWPGKRSAEWRLARMRVMADAGVSMEAIARVMTIDFPDEPVTRHQVTYALAQGTMPRSYSRLVA